MSGKEKPVKIRSYNSSNKYGVTAKNVKELLDKGCKLLKVPPAGARICLYSDGTEFTEKYFHTLPAHTELVLLSRGQSWSGGVSEALRRLLCTDASGDAVVKAAEDLLRDERSPKSRKVLSDLLLNLEDRSELETRDQDADWFRGVGPWFKTKSDYMKHSCRSRIRGYTREVKSSKSIKKAKVRKEFQKASESLEEMLKEAKYNGCYFDRSAEEEERLCTPEGWFTCQGSFDQEACSFFHSINPYSSYESRIVFSTWNLDHRIEKRRTVIPTLLGAVERHGQARVDLGYFYQLLFTTRNLKLVHIVCHKKEAHNLACDGRKLLRPANAVRGKNPCPNRQ
uniref:DNA fragmentation factor subunit beta n=1 Tax=Tetraodon nigroviridis TaxID=99883 RepID=H3D014_TETNG